MILSNNFARAFTFQNLNLNGKDQYGKYWYVQAGKGILSVSHNEHRVSHTIKDMTDGEILRLIESSLPSGMLMRELSGEGDGKASMYRMGLADRLARAHAEVDMPRNEYEKPLKVAARGFFKDVACALGMDLASKAGLVVRRGQTSTVYSPLIAEATGTIPFGDRPVRTVQLVADPSPFSDKGWFLRVNAYAFSASEVISLHEAYPLALEELKEKGYDIAVLPWIGQSH